MKSMGGPTETSSRNPTAPATSLPLAAGLLPLLGLRRHRAVESSSIAHIIIQLLHSEVGR